MEPRRVSLVWLASLLVLAGASPGCSSDDGADAGPGPGTIVATLPTDVIPLGLAGDETLLHVLGTRSDPGRGAAFFVFRIGQGHIDAEALPAIDWIDYFSANDLTLGTRFDALPEAGFLLGWQGVTVVPFDGSPSRWLVRPNLLPDGGLLLLPDGGPLLLPDGGPFPATGLFSEASQLEADGSVLVAFEHIAVPDGCSLGRFTAGGDWQDLTELAEGCGFGTVLLADPASLYVTTSDRLWRVDRATGVSAALLSGLQIGAGFNGIYQLVENEDSLTFLRLLDRGAGAELDRLAPDGGLEKLESFGGGDPIVTALAARGPSIYLLSQSALRRRLPSGGSELLAQAQANGIFGLSGYHYTRLILGDAGIFFTYTESTDAGLISTIRSVPR